MAIILRIKSKHHAPRDVGTTADVPAEMVRFEVKLFLISKIHQREMAMISGSKLFTNTATKGVEQHHRNICAAHRSIYEVTDAKQQSGHAQGNHCCEPATN